MPKTEHKWLTFRYNIIARLKNGNVLTYNDVAIEGGHPTHKLKEELVVYYNDNNFDCVRIKDSEIAMIEYQWINTVDNWDNWKKERELKK